MRTVRSSSRLLRGSASVHAGIHLPLGLGLDTPPSVGLETPLARLPNLPPGCGPGDPLARLPVGTVEGVYNGFLHYTRFLGFPEFSGYHQWQQESQ